MSPLTRLRSLTLDHHRADVALRGRVALDEAAIRAAYADPARPAVPMLVLSTCNRLEFVWVGDEAVAAWWTARLPADATACLVARRGRAAARHLVRTAAGLESQLLGEAEILGQLRAAYGVARDAGVIAAPLDLVLERALSGARRVRAESLLGTHAPSVSEAAVHAAAHAAGGSLAGRTVLVVGAGEAARGVLAALPSFAPARTILVNRHEGRAALAAAEHGVADVRPWSALAAALTEADVVCCATAAREPVVTPAHLPDGRRRWLVDLAVPRNVDPALRTRPGCTVLDLDDLRALACPEAQVGSVQLLAAEALVEREVRRIAAAVRAKARTQALGALHRLGAQLAEEEAQRVLARLGDRLSDEERGAVTQLAERVAKRVLHPVSRLLREGATTH